ncbi:transposase [Streptomyces sp. NPDC050355]|uniref:transposase n=1 Tax=Streptomyces sp. NPDC050355 TaxID=3365609 RepID=UPI0037B8E39E
MSRRSPGHFPQLLAPVGIGPDSAVTLLITMGDNPERLGSEASFATLCGASPIEHSSGRHHYRRLNRGGDRRGNAALHRLPAGFLRSADGPGGPSFPTPARPHSEPVIRGVL